MPSSRLSSKNSSCISRRSWCRGCRSARRPSSSRGSQQQRARQRHPLLLAARQLARPVREPVGRARRAPASPPPARRSSARGSRRMSPGIITFSSAVNSGSRWWNWNTKPISRLRNSASRAGAHRRDVDAVEGDRARRSARRACRARAAASTCRRPRRRPPRPSRPGARSKSSPRRTSMRRPPWSNTFVRSAHHHVRAPPRAAAERGWRRAVVMGCAKVVGAPAGVNDAMAVSPETRHLPQVARHAAIRSTRIAGRRPAACGRPGSAG